MGLFDLFNTDNELEEDMDILGLEDWQKEEVREDRYSPFQSGPGADGTVVIKDAESTPRVAYQGVFDKRPLKCKGRDAHIPIKEED